MKSLDKTELEMRLNKLEKAIESIVETKTARMAELYSKKWYLNFVKNDVESFESFFEKTINKILGKMISKQKDVKLNKIE